MTVLSADDLWKRFVLAPAAGTLKSFLLGRGQARPPTEVWAARGISFEAAAGESLGIVGANGSGKSTLLRLLGGILAPDRGRVRVAGRPAAMIELAAGFHPELTGRENVHLVAALHGLSRSECGERMDTILSFAGIGAFAEAPVKHYSSGMQARLGFAILAHLGADVLLVDEVLAVGDAEFQRRCLDWLRGFQDRGGTFVLVSHDLEQIRRHCRRAIWLDQGTVRADGPSSDVVGQYVGTAAGGERRWGDGRVRIESVRVSGASKRVGPRSGGHAQFAIAFSCREPVADPVFGLAIFDSAGRPLVGENTAALGPRIPRIAGRGEVRMDVSRLPLTSGRYVLSVAVHARGGEPTYDYRDRLVSFDVHDEGNPDEGAPVALGGRWSICGGARTARGARH